MVIEIINLPNKFSKGSTNATGQNITSTKKQQVICYVGPSQFRKYYFCFVLFTLELNLNGNSGSPALLD